MRSRKIRALLASGLVLGVGATLTLASWNDSEHVSTRLDAGFFEIEGSTGSDDPFSSSSEEDPQALTFEPGMEPMGPGGSRYALFSVRTQEGSLGGTVQVQPADWGPESTGLEGFLEYGIAVIDSTTCDESAFEGSSEFVVEPGTDLDAVDPPIGEPLDLDPDEGSSVNYCLQLTLPAEDTNGAQGLSVTPQWQFLGTSTVDE